MLQKIANKIDQHNLSTPNTTDLSQHLVNSDLPNMVSYTTLMSGRQFRSKSKIRDNPRDNILISELVKDI